MSSFGSQSETYTSRKRYFYKEEHDVSQFGAILQLNSGHLINNLKRLTLRKKNSDQWSFTDSFLFFYTYVASVSIVSADTILYLRVNN